MKKCMVVSLAALIALIAVTAGTVSAANNVSNEIVTCNVIGTHYQFDRWAGEQYPVTDLFGEEYVPLFSTNGSIWNAHVNKPARLVMDSNEIYILKPGEKIDLGEGYALEVKQISDNYLEVWLELTRDGQYIAEKIIPVETDGNNTWNVTLDNVQGENDIAVMKAHIKNLFVGTETSVVWIDGIWLIDYANARTLNVGDKSGEFTLKQVVSGVDASNPGSLVFGNTSVPDNTSVSDNASVTDVVHPSDSSAYSYPKKEQIKFIGRNTGSPISWYWNLCRPITIKSK